MGIFFTFKLNLTLKFEVIVPQNNRDLNQGFLHFLSKFGDSSLKKWQITMQKTWVDTWTDGHTHRQTQ